MDIRVSIVILSFNQASETIDCLTALHPIPSDFEIILVDNGSSDDTARQISHLFPATMIVKMPHNIGVAAGRNAGIRKASGRYIMLLDNDTLPSVSAIQELASFLDNNPRCALAAPRLTWTDGTTQRSFRPFPGLIEKLRSLTGLSHDAIRDNEIPLTPFSPFYVIGAAQMIRKEVFDNVGLLDERIFYGPEDADLCMRIRSSGIGEISYLPHIVIIHQWRRASRSPLSTLWWHHAKSLLYFYIRHHRLL